MEETITYERKTSEPARTHTLCIRPRYRTWADGKIDEPAQS